MTRRATVALSLCVLIGLATGVASVSAYWLQQASGQGVVVDYAHGSPRAGQAFVSIASAPSGPVQPLWLALTWRWCPQLNPLRWCVTANGDVVSGEAKLALGIGSLTVSDGLISGNNVNALFGGFVEATANIEASVRHLRLRKAPQLAAIQSIDASVLVSDIEALGLAFQAHRIDATGTAADSPIALEIHGPEATGTVSLSRDGHYQTQLLLSPAPGVRAMIEQQLPKNNDGQLVLQRSGNLGLPQ